MAEERTRRRLAAILAADVVGYSRLMEQDEAGTLAALKLRWKEVLDPLVAKHEGRTFKVAGDGVLVEFASAVNAVQCAVELQQKTAEANIGLEEERTIVLRVGINLGDVVVEGDDLYGDGVNVAARLEAIAEPGTVCISGSVYAQVKGKLKLEYEDLGRQQLKNIAEPVQAYCIRIEPRLKSREAPNAGLPLPDKPSIAVLSFVNMSGDPEQEYFTDGITEDIITELSRFHELFVIARNSSFTFKGKTIKVQDIARELGVTYIVEGSVRRAGDRVRVTAQLVDAGSGNHLWAERYDRDLQEIFAVQDEVAATIVSTLIGRVATGGAERARRKPPQLWVAYDYFLQGRELQQRFDLEGGASMLRRAIELDPSYAPAYVWLAAACYLLYSAQGRPEDLEEGFRAAQKAMALDPQDSGGHRALASIYALMRRFDLAGVHFERAAALNPNDVTTSILHGLWLAYVGRGEEAVRSLQADLRRDPFPPTWYWECCGIALFQTRRYAEVITSLQQMGVLHYWSYCYLASSYAHLGQMDAAKQAAAEALRLKPDFAMRDIERSEWWRDPADLENLKNGLRKAGLPE